MMRREDLLSLLTPTLLRNADRRLHIGLISVRTLLISHGNKEIPSMHADVAILSQKLNQKEPLLTLEGHTSQMTTPTIPIKLLVQATEALVVIVEVLQPNFGADQEAMKAQQSEIVQTKSEKECMLTKN